MAVVSSRSWITKVTSFTVSRLNPISSNARTVALPLRCSATEPCFNALVIFMVALLHCWQLGPPACHTLILILLLHQEDTTASRRSNTLDHGGGSLLATWSSCLPALSPVPIRERPLAPPHQSQVAA